MATDYTAMLTAVDTAITNRLAGGAVQSYSIGGRNIQYLSLKELWDLRKEIEIKIATTTTGAGRNHAQFVRPT